MHCPAAPLEWHAEPGVREGVKVKTIWKNFTLKGGGKQVNFHIFFSV